MNHVKDKFDFYLTFTCAFYVLVKILVFHLELFYVILKNIPRKSVFEYEKHIKHVVVRF